MPSLNSSFPLQTADSELRDDLEQLVRLAIREDLRRSFDLTTCSLVPEDVSSRAQIVAREAGCAAGLDLLHWIVECIGCDITVELHIKDGDTFQEQQSLAQLSGDARDLLTCERTILNFLGRMCGIASKARHYTQLIKDLDCDILDTRKTTPGWRRLEKYSVACGGARNHRMGLYDAILIKDNHLACRARAGNERFSPKEAVLHARKFLTQQPDVRDETVVEIEVDTLEQLRSALEGKPDIVLLDNMSRETLSEAVAIRDQQAAGVILEASGGVTERTLRAIAETGVDRISMGSLTHSAINLDLGLDWMD